MRCKFCKEEMDEHLDYCPKCGAPQEPNKEEDPVLVIQAVDDLEADRIEAALSDGGIPVSRQYTGPISFLKTITGNSSGSVQLYVPAQAEDKAVEILIGIGALESSELQTEENPDQAEQLPGARGKSIVATVLLLLLVALVVFSVDGIMTVVKQLFGIS